MTRVKLEKVILMYNNGKSYEIKGDELDMFNDYLLAGMHCLSLHKFDFKDWNELFKKVHRKVGIDD